MARYRPTARGLPRELEFELRLISAAFEALASNPIRVLHVAPDLPRDGDVAICDGSDWNPLSDGVKRPIWYDEDAATWKKFD